MLNNHRLFFYRLDNSKIDVASLLTCQTADASAKQVMARLRRAITQWINTTEEGKKQWKSSFEDFNVGDLSGLLGDWSLIRCLEANGIHDFDITGVILDCDAFHYDTVLANPNEISL